MTKKNADKCLVAAHALAGDLAGALDLNASLCLWDGSIAPLGTNVTSPLQVTISGPGVIASILKRPGLDRIIRHCARGSARIFQTLASFSARGESPLPPTRADLYE